MKFEKTRPRKHSTGERFAVSRAIQGDFRWSSYGEYLKAPGIRWRWLRVDRLLGEHGIPKDSAAGRVQFEKAMERRRAEEDLNLSK